MIDFDPAVHKEGVVLYERRSVRDGDISCMTVVESDIPYDEAAMTPWYYMVKDDKKTLVRIKGGPGSGHYGHAGRPGKRGGSVPASVAMSLRTGATAAERQAAASARGRAIREIAKKHGYTMAPPDKINWVSQDDIDMDKFKELVPERFRADPNYLLRAYLPPGLYEAGITPAQFVYSTFDGGDFEASIKDEEGNVIRTEIWTTKITSIGVDTIGGITQHDPAGNALTVRGIVLDEAGYEKGNFNRTVGSNGHVYHGYFSMQGKDTGFGSAFYKHTEDRYAAIGCEAITLSANISVGGYAWARMGFDFRYDTYRETMASSLTNTYVNSMRGRGHTIDAAQVGDIRNRFRQLKAWEMAAITTPEGDKVGKAVMLGSAWSGIKYLNEDSEHRQAGLVYYESKAKQRKVKK